MGGDHQVVVAGVEGQGHDRHRGHPVLEAQPVPAAVLGDPEPEFGAEEEEVRVDGVLLESQAVAAELRGRQALPALAEVVGAVDVGSPVRAPVVVEHRVGRAGVPP